MPRLQALYRDKIVPDLCTEFAYRNRLMAPRIEKIVLNMGLSLRSGDIKSIEADRKNRAETARAELGLIAGQRPVVTRARKGIAAFRLREGQPIGVKVTLRRSRMYEFLDRLVTVALPRVRDFHGLSGNSFDGRGNYSLGVREHIAFPEIDYDKVDAIRGFDVTITTSAKTDGEARALLRGFNLPFVA